MLVLVLYIGINALANPISVFPNVFKVVQMRRIISNVR